MSTKIQNKTILTLFKKEQIFRVLHWGTTLPLLRLLKSQVTLVCLEALYAEWIPNCMILIENKIL